MARRFHQKRKYRPGMVALALVAVVGMALLLGGRVFVLRRVAVQGNRLYEDRQIVDRSGLRLGQSIFFIDQGQVQKAFEQDGDIALEGVSVRFPDTVELTVRERQGRAYVSYLGTALLVDERMTVMRQLPSLPADSMLLVTGMTVSAATPGQPIKTTTPGQTQAVGAVLAAMDALNMAGQVSELNVADLDNLYLITRGGMMVELGDELDMNDKFMWMGSVLPQLAGEGIVTGTLDVTSGKSAIYSP